MYLDKSLMETLVTADRVTVRSVRVVSTTARSSNGASETARPLAFPYSFDS